MFGMKIYKLCEAAQAIFGTSQYTLVRILFMARDTKGG
jgi:hypothetical protein